MILCYPTFCFEVRPTSARVRRGHGMEPFGFTESQGERFGNPDATSGAGGGSDRSGIA